MDVGAPEKQLYVEATVAPDQLDAPLYATDTAEIVIGDGDQALGSYQPASAGLRTIRDAVVRAVAENQAESSQVREHLESGQEITVSITDAAGSASDMDRDAVANYLRADGIQRTPFSQDAMDHEYVDGNCHSCGDDLDILKAEPEAKDVDVYMYDCSTCGESGHYFGGDTGEDGAVTVTSVFTEEEDLRREIDLREGTHLSVYEVDNADGVKAGRHIYTLELGSDWRTRPDGLLQRLIDQPLRLTEDVRETIEQHKKDPSFGIELLDQTGRSDIEHGPDDHYVKVIHDTQIHMGK